MTFGLRFREARNSRHLSQEAVGEQLGVSKATVSSWELDKKLPECERLPAIREALSCSLDWLFGERGATIQVAEDRAVYASQDMKPGDLSMAIQLANEKIAAAGLAPTPEQYGQFVLQLYDVLVGGLPNADVLDLRSGKLRNSSTGDDGNDTPASKATGQGQRTAQPAVQHGGKARRKS